MSEIFLLGDFLEAVVKNLHGGCHLFSMPFNFLPGFFLYRLEQCRFWEVRVFSSLSACFSVYYIFLLELYHLFVCPSPAIVGFGIYTIYVVHIVPCLSESYRNQHLQYLRLYVSCRFKLSSVIISYCSTPVFETRPRVILETRSLCLDDSYYFSALSDNLFRQILYSLLYNYHNN